MRLMRTILTACLFLIVMSLATGLLYPLAVTGFAQLVFPRQANGSLLSIDGKLRGSFFLAQEFTHDKFFHGRPSAGAYATIPSGASNLSPTSPVLQQELDARRTDWRKSHGDAIIPDDLLYASASGLDPDISLEAALAQVDTVASARGLKSAQKENLVTEINARSAIESIFAPLPRVNVMELNYLLETDPRFVVK